MVPCSCHLKVEAHAGQLCILALLNLLSKVASKDAEEVLDSCLGVELLNCFGALRNSMLCKLIWENESHCRLDFARGKRFSLVGLGELRRFLRNLIEAVHHERVHDAQ